MDPVLVWRRWALPWVVLVVMGGREEGEGQSGPGALAGGLSLRQGVHLWPLSPLHGLQAAAGREFRPRQEGVRASGQLGGPFAGAPAGVGRRP